VTIFDSAHDDGLDSATQKKLCNSKKSKKQPVLFGLLFLGAIYLGSMGFCSIRNGGYISLQFRDFILIISGQAKLK
jgi:hypothetical protein